MANTAEKPIIIASRGSALALAQANFILAECRREFPNQQFELKIIKTTGDKLQQASMARIDATLPRGLFTKEIEEALLSDEADLAVHSLKDLPTLLPDSLKLGATPKREDVRDVLITKLENVFKIADLPKGARVGTSSTRRKAQLLEQRPDLNIVEIRGNVGTRLQKLADQDFDAIILAAAGLLRLKFTFQDGGILTGNDAPAALRASTIDLSEMLPCVGQASLGIEIRENDPRLEIICERLNHLPTWHCVNAERAFLRGMGGGCQSAVGAHAEISGNELQLRAVSYLGANVRRGETRCAPEKGVDAGVKLANELKP